MQNMYTHFKQICTWLYSATQATPKANSSCVRAKRERSNEEKLAKCYDREYCEWSHPLRNYISGLIRLNLNSPIYATAERDAIVAKNRDVRSEILDRLKKFGECSFPSYLESLRGQWNDLSELYVCSTYVKRRTLKSREKFRGKFLSIDHV